MFILADQFHIKPWEYNETGEVYQEDLVDLKVIKQIQWKAEKDEADRSAQTSGSNNVMRVR